MRRVIATMGLVLACMALQALGAKGPQYSYGQAWWQEYPSDRDTVLLLHFGPPTVTAGEHLVRKLDAQKKEADFLAPESVKAAGAGGEPGSGMDLLAPEDLKLPPVNDRNVPADMVLDYGDGRQRLTLGEGMSVVPAGRFGAGLRCAGKGGLTATVRNPQMGECSFRIAAYPARTNCLMSFDRDEARLVLRPDGRLELKLRKPYGIMDRKKLAPAAIQVIMRKDASIVSPDAVPTNQWVHVAIWSKPHPAPGNTSPFDARLTVDGTDVAWYLSEGGNAYQDFLGRQASAFVLANSAAGDEGFSGDIDEVRVSCVARELYERPAMPWRDMTLARPLQFGKPYFRCGAPAFHASLDNGFRYDAGGSGGTDITLDLKGQTPEGLYVEGIRGKGWLVDPLVGFPRFDLKGMSAAQGALEFWLRPVNWDDVTGYWQHSPPPQKDLSVVRVMDAAGRVAFNVTLPRAHNLEAQRVPLDPGRWIHFVLVWDRGGWALFADGKVLNGRRRDQEADLSRTLAYAEFGITDNVTVIRNEPPRIEIDEVVGYRSHLRADEVAQARRRWMGPLQPIPLCDERLSFKYSLQKLEFTLEPLLPEGENAQSCTVSLCESNGPVVLGPFESQIVSGRFAIVMSEGRPLPYKAYQARFQVKDGAGKVVIDGIRNWDYREDPWRNCRAGILDKTPEPWTSIKVDGHTLTTRMTTYTLGSDGLPEQIKADGEDLLAGPFGLLEDGLPMTGTSSGLGVSKDVEADWEAVFKGKTCDVAMKCHAEYDGMIRYELALQPHVAAGGPTAADAGEGAGRAVPRHTPDASLNGVDAGGSTASLSPAHAEPACATTRKDGGRIAPIRFVIPLQASHASRCLYYPMGARGVATGVVGTNDGPVVESRHGKTDGYGFFGHVDLNDMNRGLFWFCDNAAGWSQSPKVSAIEVVRRGATVSLVLNLVAESGDYVPSRPIVFGVLPHPARPLPAAYRLFNRVSPDLDAKHCDIYDAFYPWPMDPRDHSMKLYPAVDPKTPGEGPSWSYAERCIPIMRACKARGSVTMYLSRAWFGCRAGAYDNWEWRSGGMGAVSLTPWFDNYLCWEMDEWIRRGIWDAIYLDECYETPARNLEAGLSVRLPDGTEQPGVQNFMFRDLMKRWRNLFTAHGREPLLMAHHTYSWQYQGLVFCDSTLDGENAPIVSLNSRDWIDSTSKDRFEVLQNARLWGVSTFYMPFIAEGGFDNKEKSQYPRWQWRMARQAQSEFAHYETATVYEGQGSQVYKAYWATVLGWGGGDPKTATFHPYWDNARFVQVADQGGDTLVSFYRQPGKVLLLASNRSRETKTLRITVNASALGLPPEFKVRDVDGDLRPPAGNDFVSGADKAAAASALDDSLGTGLNDKQLAPQEVDALLTSPEQRQAAEERVLAPRVEGSVLVLPVRGRDYRQVALE